MHACVTALLRGTFKFSNNMYRKTLKSLLNIKIPNKAYNIINAFHKSLKINTVGVGSGRVNINIVCK